MKHLKGVVCATITPMLPNGSVDLESVASLTEHLAKKGIHCLYPNGTNGESLSLSFEERTAIAEAVVKANQGRSTVYIQCGAATVAESYKNVEVSAACGADGAGLMTPVFFPMDESAMEQYYTTLLDRITDHPIYVYNIFTRTGNDVSARLLGSLMDRYPNLHGIKFSYPDTNRIHEYANAPASRTADALIGCDMLAKQCVESGGCGWVSGPAAVFAELHTGLYAAIREGREEDANRLQEAICETMAKIAGIPEIPAIKYMLMKMGVIRHALCRPPFRALTREETATLDRVLAEYVAAYGA